MPLTINGYHVFQLQCRISEMSVTKGFSELSNDLGDGYEDELLYGSEVGTRRWAASFPTLPDGTLDSGAYTGINGEQLSSSEYLEDLYDEVRVTGTPFVLQNPKNGGYYLVKFADPEITFRRKLTRLDSTELIFKQVRYDGVTVLQPQEFSQSIAVYDPANWTDPAPFPFVGPIVLNSVDTDLSNELIMDSGTSDVIQTTVNDVPILRFSNTTNNGVLTALGTVLAKDILLLMKMREATFSNDAGIVTAAVSVAALVGDSGTTKFTDLGLGANYQYRLDGVEYDEDDQQAPMNTWGVVHLRYTDGFPLILPQIGKDRADATRHAEMDLAYAIFSDELFPKSKLREIDEMLAVMRSLLI